MADDELVLEVVVGTYEKYLLGYTLQLEADEFVLKPSFTAGLHLQSVKCISSSDRFLASGSLDETIQLFNMKNRKELGALIHHNGTLTDLQFHDSYMFSCSEDCNICMWSTKDWQCRKTLAGHKKRVNSISIHPSGKMALSVSKDKFLRTWNLVTGRSVYCKRLRGVSEIVRFSPTGVHFLVSYDTDLDVYAIDTANVRFTINFRQKICDFAFITDDIFAVAGESEFIRCYDAKTGGLVYEFQAHNTRVKALKSIVVSEESFLVSVSSDGIIKVWHQDYAVGYRVKYSAVAQVNTESRPTCMTVMAKC